jgi:hypothetical protein
MLLSMYHCLYVSLVSEWLNEPSHLAKVLYVELPVQEATIVDGALEHTSQKT